MTENRYYYFDEQSGTFVEVKPKRYNPITLGAIGLAVVIFLVGGVLWGSKAIGLVSSPKEAQLASENEVLKDKLTDTETRINEVFTQLESLYEKDNELYRTLLNADPISEDVHEAGVGGTDSYEEYAGFTGSTSSVLRRTSQMLDKLERQLKLQNESYQELIPMAENRENQLKSKPAILPVDGGRISSGFGMRLHPIYKARKHHDGLDIVVPRNTPVYTTGDGVITFTGRKGGYGNVVMVTHNETGYVTLYAHLDHILSNMQVGSKVNRGDLIAYSGNTGTSTAPHLHYEVQSRDGEKFDPMLFIAPSVTPSKFREMLELSESDNAMLEDL